MEISEALSADSGGVEGNKRERLNECGCDRDGEVGRVTFTLVDRKCQAAVSEPKKDWKTFSP